MFKLFKSAFFLLILICVISTLQTHAIASGKIFLPKTAYDVGLVEEGRIITFDFNLVNKGDTILAIKGVRSSCECLEAEDYSQTITPEETSSIKLSLDTKGLEVEFEKYLYIHSSDENNPIVRAEIRGRIVQKKLAPPTPKVLRKEVQEKEREVREKPRVSLLFFTSLTCRECARVKQRLILPLEEKHKGILDIQYLEIENMENYQKLVSLEEKLGKRKGKIPTIFISGRLLSGRREIERNLESIVEKAIQALPEPGDVEDKKGIDLEKEEGEIKEQILERFHTFRFWTVAGAGLLDGINPCAFATIVFFVSFLTFTGCKRGEIFFVGIMFTLAVFLAYFAIGIGIFNFLYHLEGFFIISEIIFYLIFFLVIALGFLSIYDYIQYRRGRGSNGMILQLPPSIKRMIHKLIREKMEKGKYPTRIRLGMAAFIAGIMVSVLESVCTGQVYLPTIAFVLKMTDVKGGALLYLLVYNLMFIIPLLIVLVLTTIGARTDIFSAISKKHLGSVKLLTALFFFILAFVLYLTI